MKNWIDNKTILITGASSGIGRELSRVLIDKNNCHVIGVGRREEKLIEFKNSLGEKSENFEYRVFDVGEEKNWKDLQNEFVLNNTKLDVVINNAGVLPPFANFSNLSKLSKKNASDNVDAESECEYLTKIIEINLLSNIYSAYYLCPIIEKSDTPAMINVSSSAGLCGLPGISIYSASKSGAKNFTEILAAEKKYYVGLVCPGFTKTEIFRSQTRESKSKLIDLISTDLSSMVNKIYRGIKKKKKRMVLGFDAKFMDFLYRHFPRTAVRFLGCILKSSKIELFKDVFDY